MPRTHHLISGGLAAALLVLAACGGTSRVDTDKRPTRVTTELQTSQPADITILDDQGEAVRTVEWREGRSRRTTLDFRRTAYYTLVATPTEEALETHDITRVTVGLDDLYIVEDGELQPYLVDIREKEYRNVDELVIFRGDQGAWSGLRIQSRAFDGVGEEGGAATRRLVDLGPELAVWGIDIAPDGESLVFAQAAFDRREAQAVSQLDDASGNSEMTIPLASSNICGLALSSSGIQQITSGNYLDMYPVYAGDGQDLLFSSNRRRKNDADLLMISAKGRSGISNVYVDSRGLTALAPSQADNGLIAFALEDRDDPDNSYIWTLGGRNEYPTQIVQGRQPRVSPDGQRIAYIGTDGNLWVVAIDGTQQTQLTSDAGVIQERFLQAIGEEERLRYRLALTKTPETLMPYAHPSWTPDGKRILYSSMESNDNTGRPNQDIWIMAYDGSGKLQLTTNGSADRYPLMSPDQQTVYFVSNRGKRWGIYQIDAPAQPE